jgi:Xaa-Pro aminopeptidase
MSALLDPQPEADHNPEHMDIASHFSRFAERRRTLQQRMQSGIAVIPTAPVHMRNRDSDYLYRFDSYFYHLTGFPEPESVLVVLAGDQPRSILFCRQRDPERELWDGFRHGPDGAKDAFGLDQAFSIDVLDEQLPKLVANQPALYCAPGADAGWDARLMRWLNEVRLQARTGISAPAQIVDVRTILDEMRLVKDEGELALMRRAAAISGAAHERAMRATRPGRREYEIEAELLYEFRRQGAQFPAYWPIVASGANTCVLHYRENSALLADGDLVLIDAGCELDGYASDVTRTFPVNGKFSGPQKNIYELVLAAQSAAIASVRPGNRWDEPHESAVKILAQGFIDLGLCRGTLEGVLGSGDYKRFYMHRTGHWLGLDVHDAGEYRSGGEWRRLQPGMTLTVEPGCYIRPAKEVPEAFWNIGVRIEDDVAVTAQGCEVLTRATPKSVEDVEALVGRG